MRYFVLCLLFFFPVCVFAEDVHSHDAHEHSDEQEGAILVPWFALHEGVRLAGLRLTSPLIEERRFSFLGTASFSGYFLPEDSGVGSLFFSPFVSYKTVGEVFGVELQPNIGLLGLERKDRFLVLHAPASVLVRPVDGVVLTSSFGYTLYTNAKEDSEARPFFEEALIPSLHGHMEHVPYGQGFSVFFEARFTISR